MKKCIALILSVLLIIPFIAVIPVSAGSVKGEPFSFDLLDPDKYTYEVQVGGFYSDAPENALNWQSCEFYLYKKVTNESGEEELEYDGEGSCNVTVLWPEGIRQSDIEALGKLSFYSELNTREYMENYGLQDELDSIKSEHDFYSEFYTEGYVYSGDIHYDSNSIRRTYSFTEGEDTVGLGIDLTQIRDIPEFPGIVIVYYFHFEQGRENVNPSTYSAAVSMLEKIISEPYQLDWQECRIFDDVVTTSSVVSEASSQAGDVEFTVPAAIVLGVVSGGAAVGAALASAGAAASAAAAAGASSAGASAASGAGTASYVEGESSSLDSDSSEDKKTDKKTFKMFVNKNFGDAVRRGANSVNVSARMVEEEGGSVKGRPDLSASISATAGDGLVLDALNFDGKAMTAKIHAEDDTKSDKGYITFSFTGEGGTFNNTIKFKIVDKPSIRFPDQSSGSDDMYLDVIAGDNGKYRVMFVFEDAVSEPQSISFEAAEYFDITYEQAEYERSYYALISNRTDSLQNVPFSKPENVTIGINADFANDDSVCGYFYIQIHPEGLTVSSFNLENERMLIDAREDESASEYDYKLRHVPFSVCFATSIVQNGYSCARFLEGRDLNVIFEKLTGDAFYAENFDETFKYHVEQRDVYEGKYEFVPENVLAQAEDPYHMEMEVICTVDGNDYTQFVPLTLIGKLPPKGPTDWDKEYALLKKDIMYFGLSANSNVRELIGKAKSLTANDLCMIRRAIITEATYYYMAERREFESLDASLGRYEFVFSSVKWIMDQAFSYMISTYYGGPYVDAIVSPMKDLIGEFLGQLTASAYWGDKVKLKGTDLINTAITGAENAASNYMGDALKATPVNLKKIGGVCGAMLAVGFFKRYAGISDNGDYEGDIYNSMVKSFGDLTTNVLKNMFSNYLGNVLKSDKGMCKTVGDFLSKHIVGNMNSADVVAKYVSETFGLVVANVYDNLSKDTSEVINKDGTFNIFITVGSSTLEINPMACISGISGILYDVILKPFADIAKPLKVGTCETYYRS